MSRKPNKVNVGKFFLVFRIRDDNGDIVSPWELVGDNLNLESAERNIAYHLGKSPESEFVVIKSYFAKCDVLKGDVNLPDEGLPDE